MKRVLCFLLIGLDACVRADEPPGHLAPSAVAATQPAPVEAPAPDAGAPSGPGQPATLDLEPVDGRDAGAIVELAPPSSRRAPCLASGKCAFGEGLWVETREGFVNRWALAEVGDAKLKKERDPARLFERVGASWRAFTVPGPILELAPEGKLEGKASAPVWVLATRVHSEGAGAALLKLSANGDATVALNGKVVHAELGDQYVLADHRSVKADLVAGWNVIAVRLEKLSPYAVRFALRLRGVDGAPLPGLTWGLPEGAASASGDVCSAIATTFEPHIMDSGWRVAVRVTTRGLLSWPMPTEVSFTAGAAVVAKAPFAPDETVRVLSADLPDASTRLSVTVDGASCATLDLVTVPGRARYFAARAAYAGRELPPGDRDSLDYQADDVARLFAEAAMGAPPRRLEGALDHFEQHALAAGSGADPFRQPGLHVRAYRSDYDGSLQRYVVVVPKGYGKEPAPLIMLAHGLEYSPEDMLRIALAKPSGPGDSLRNGTIYRWDPPEPPSGAILVAHDGYGNAGQRAPGEVDVRRVIDEMKAAYRIEPRRVSISGFSLGGSVAFWVPFHAPSLFSAAAPLCGYPNILEYRSVKAAAKRPWEVRLLDEDGVVPYAEGGKYLPLKMVHGAMDQPSRSELMHERYQTLRYPSELDILPLGHNVWDAAFEDGKLLRWLAARRRPVVAPQPVVRAGRYRWSTNYWLRIDRFTDEAAFGQLDGAFKGERLQVGTRNVAAFTLLGDELGERAQKPHDLVIDGRNIGSHVVGKALHLSRASGSWAVTEAIDRPPDGKRPGLEGPLGDVWYGPLLVVYGTQQARELEANRLAAERLAMHAPWIDVRVKVLADVEVSAVDLVGKSVVLVGRPAVNSLTARAAPALEAAGIRFEEHALVFGGRRFEGPDIGVSLIRPSPFDPDRYLVLHAGLGPEGTLSARYLPELAPDYLVYDSHMREVFGDRILGPRDALLGGFFDARWRLPEADKK